MTEIATVYAVFGSTEEAERIGRTMVERRLAACVNILAPAQSIYSWEGQIEHSEEIPALFKTQSDLTNALITAIAEMHSYDVPAICQWPIEQSWDEYRAWVTGQTGEPK